MRSVAFVSVVPSPYQRDLFRALADRADVELRVFYLEQAAPDSPWPEKPLASYESILPGCWLPIGSARCHVNWPLPDLARFDVVVLNTLMSFTGQWLMRVTLRRKPWIFWGERLNRGSALHSRLAAPLHRAAGIAAIGNVAQRDYRERFPAPGSFCIPYYCDLQPFAEAPRPVRSHGETVFLFCGQMIARKGVDLLLESFAQLDSSARLLLVGREADLPQWLAGLPKNVRERCEYAGFQPPEALPEFFARADVFVLPSRYDGWGVVVNQAIGSGLPIVCSDAVGAGHDLVEEGINGTRFANGDVGALTAAMRRLLDEPGLAKKWGEASKARAKEWSPEVGAAQWVAAFDAVMTR